VKTYDPIPRLIKKRKANGFAKEGWYIFSYDGVPVVGPRKSPEECISALSRLSAARHSVSTPATVTQITAIKRNPRSHSRQSG